MANKTVLLVWSLIIVIVLLVGIIVFSSFVKPAISGYAIGKQTEGYDTAINQIISQVQQNGFVQIPVENQNIICSLQPTQQIQAPPEVQ